MSFSELTRDVSLQSHKVGDKYFQFKVTVPSDFIDLLGWSKSDVIEARLVLGSGQLVLEKKGDEQ